jgi:hypothetical protein
MEDDCCFLASNTCGQEGRSAALSDPVMCSNWQDLRRVMQDGTEEPRPHICIKGMALHDSWNSRYKGLRLVDLGLLRVDTESVCPVMYASLLSYEC